MPATRIDELHRAGFDFLRIAVDPGPLLQADAPALRRRLMEISTAVSSTLALGMKVVVDIHPSTDHPRWNFQRLTSGPNTPTFSRLIEVERALAAELTRYDPRNVALEVFNEPPPPCRWRDRPEWPVQLQTIVERVRAVAPQLTLLLAGACWAAPEGLALLDPAKFDTNTIFVFHYYEPFVFTHQGFWGSQKYLEFVPPLHFPPDPAIRDSTIAAVLDRIRSSSKITADIKARQTRAAAQALREYFDQNQGPQFVAGQLDQVGRWADAHGVDRSRVILGEFGAMKDVYDKIGAPPADRARWIDTTRTSAERNGFRWSAWALTNTMGIVTGDVGGPLDPAILMALGLHMP
jgi:hypothetical protein